ncbi:Fc.00g094180.m01.CDS01 [Cosmosporella sp. VM-42]
MRREEKFFVDTAVKYGIEINLDPQNIGRVPESAKLVGLRRWEKTFDSAVFQVTVQGGDPSQDQDGGAVRIEFINNWTSAEFVTFADELGVIIDEAVEEEVKLRGQVKKFSVIELEQRGRKYWQLRKLVGQLFSSFNSRVQISIFNNHRESDINNECVQCLCSCKPQDA